MDNGEYGDIVHMISGKPEESFMYTGAEIKCTRTELRSSSWGICALYL